MYPYDPTSRVTPPTLIRLAFGSLHPFVSKIVVVGDHQKKIDNCVKIDLPSEKWNNFEVHVKILQSLVVIKCGLTGKAGLDFLQRNSRDELRDILVVSAVTSFKGDSMSSTAMAAFCGKRAQHSGVENVRHAPVNNTYATVISYRALESTINVSITVAGAFNQGFLMNVAVRSRRLITSGGMNMAGAAIPTRDGMT